MALADYQPVKREIALPDGNTFHVRALSLGDISPIMAINQDAIEFFVVQIGDRVRRGTLFDSNDEQDVQVITGLVSEAVRSSPTLVGAIIAYASDEPSQYMEALKLPLTVQAEALQHICELTFTDLAALKRMIVSATNIWRGLFPTAPMALPSAA